MRDGFILAFLFMFAIISRAMYVIIGALIDEDSNSFPVVLFAVGVDMLSIVAAFSVIMNHYGWVIK